MAKARSKKRRFKASPSKKTSSVEALVQKVHRHLLKLQARAVLAESCTGGAIAAALSAQPGASRVLVGSFVVYRPSAKHEWLGLSSDFLNEYTDVSSETSAAIAESALDRASEAQFALSITGHLGPKAPKLVDGKVYVAVAVRGQIVEREFGLKSKTREARAREAMRVALEYFEESLREFAREARSRGA